jgi:hypothetical protein
VESTSKPIESLVDPAADGLASAASPETVSPTQDGGVAQESAGVIERGPHVLARVRIAGPVKSVSAAFVQVRFALGVYLATRVLLLVVAYINGRLRHTPLTLELSNWDGLWYRSIADYGTPLGGYPHAISHLQTNLGFFPPYPYLMRALSFLFYWTTPYGRIGAIATSGIVISTIGGFVATVLVQRMATDWWDAQAGRRTVLLFCLFPGSVIFSMIYAEGIAIPLAAGCIYALTKRRWVLAGILAAMSTAVEAETIVLVLVCAVSAVQEFRRRGWSFRAARRSLWAPFLSIWGAIGVGVFMWVWTGSPLAIYIAQHDGWHEKTSPFALIHDASLLASQISFTDLTERYVNLNLLIGLVGAVLLVVLIVLMFKQRRAVPIEAIVWTLGIAFFTFTSWNIPPNPRLLITAFPAIMVAAYYLRGKWLAIVLWINGVLLAGLSAITFVGVALRP